MNLQSSTIIGTLVLIAPANASPDELRELVSQASAVHVGPVVVLPHGWQAMSGDAARAKIKEAETQSIGASKPPPPPPPPP